MKTITTCTALLAAILAVGCGKKKDENKASEPAKTETPAPKAEAPAKAAGPDFSAWDGPGKLKAWEGSWLAKENGTIQAWTVTGTKVQTWDGEKENSYELVMEAPCRVSFKGDGGMMFPRDFTVVDGGIQYRGGGAGYRNGDKAIFCDASGSIFTLDDKGCTVWKDHFGKWESSPGDCKLEKNADGADVFTHGDPNGGQMEIRGDAILSHSSFETEKVDGDFAAAKAARDAKAKADK